jgi:hypothetical protein
VKPPTSERKELIFLFALAALLAAALAGIATISP